MKPDIKLHLLEVTCKQIRANEIAVSDSTRGVREAAVTSDTKEDPTFVWDAQKRANQVSAGLQTWRAFLTELQQAGPKNRVEPGAQIKVSLDGQEVGLLVMRTKVLLPSSEIQIITPNAPLILAIQGQPRRFNTTFETPQGRHEVKILEIH